MIVDVHAHVFRVPEDVDPTFLRDLKRAYHGRDIDFNVTFEALMGAMASCDRVICFGMRALKTGLHTPNEYVAGVVARAPEKLIGFMSLDPNEPAWLDDFEHSLKDLKLRGVKLAPLYADFDPRDRKLDELYSRCVANNLPILFHAGTSFVQFGPVEWGKPYLWDEVARRFPDLRMVLAHLGHPWEGECIAVIRKHPNVYADVSALCYRPWQFYNSMRLAEEYGVQHKLLFGTDYHFTTPESAFAGSRGVNRICEGTSLPGVDPEALEEMLHRDAVRLLWS